MNYKDLDINYRNNAHERNVIKAFEYLKNAGLTESQILLLCYLGYFTAPASKGHHGAFKGGLIAHSIRVAEHMVELKVFKNDVSNYKVGLLHDLVKCFCYKAKTSLPGYDYVEPPYPGHGVASVLIAQELDIPLDPCESAAIVWHMGPWDMDEGMKGPYRAALKLYGREMLLTHAADHLSSIEEDAE